MQGAEIRLGFKGYFMDLLWDSGDHNVCGYSWIFYGYSMDILWVFVVDIFAGGIKNNL